MPSVWLPVYVPSSEQTENRQKGCIERVVIQKILIHLEVPPGPGVPLDEHVVRDGAEPCLQPPHARPGGGVGVDVVDERRLGPDVRPGRPDSPNGLLRRDNMMIGWSVGADGQFESEQYPPRYYNCNPYFL